MYLTVDYMIPILNHRDKIYFNKINPKDGRKDVESPGRTLERSYIFGVVSRDDPILPWLFPTYIRDLHNVY